MFTGRFVLDIPLGAGKFLNLFTRSVNMLDKS